MMRAVALFSIATLLASSCTSDEVGLHPTSEAIGALTAPVLLADEDDTRFGLSWEIHPTRALGVFSAATCADVDCATQVMELFAFDERGEPWLISELSEQDQFGFDPEGVLVRTSADGTSIEITLDSPAPVATGTRPADEGPLLFPIGGFTPLRDIDAVLDDGRILIRGEWAEDDVAESWFQFHNEEGRRDNARRPMRLFVYDPAADLLAPISDIPQSHEWSTAMTQSFGPDSVLRVALLPGGNTVAYSVGFNGAGYDIDTALYIAPIPPP